MKNYFLFTSPCTGPLLNPGSHLIADGIKALVRRMEPDAIFSEVSLFHHSALNWEVIFASADAIFLCGNPRFEPSDIEFYWLTDLLQLMIAAKKKGIKVGDLFLGAAYPLPYTNVTAMRDDLLQYARNRETVGLLSELDMVITRDSLSQALCSERVKHCRLLPDSTFFARDFWNVRKESRSYNCVTFPRLHCEEWVLKRLYDFAKVLSEDKKTYFLCTCWEEYKIAMSVLATPSNIVLIYDPESLLRFYSNVDYLISCRLHSSIPALSLGVRVINIAMDSRSLAYDNFGFTSVPYLDLKAGVIDLDFNHLEQVDYPSPEPFIEILKEALCQSSTTKE